ncbi:MAG: hypothetical protein ACRD2F_04710 [Terriglobales bacterium]
MANHRKLRTPDGKEHNAVIVEFEPERENVSTYILEDGTTLKLRAVLTEVARVDGEYMPNGDPVYAIQAAQIVSVNAPERLRKQP